MTDQKEQWWRGTCEGRSGIFPANYVQRASEMDATIIPGLRLFNTIFKMHFRNRQKNNNWSGDCGI